MNNFVRGKTPKASIRIGMEEDGGYNITGLSDENFLLPGIKIDDIYLITHIGSRSTAGFCSGKNLTKVLISLMKKGYSNYRYKWIWKPYSSGGSLEFYYGGSGDDWTDANNTMGYGFTRMDESSIIEL